MHSEHARGIDQTTVGQILESKEVNENGQAWEACGHQFFYYSSSRSAFHFRSCHSLSGYFLGFYSTHSPRPVGVNQWDDGPHVNEPICGMPEMKIQTTMLKSRPEICSRQKGNVSREQGQEVNPPLTETARGHISLHAMWGRLSQSTVGGGSCIQF